MRRAKPISVIVKAPSRGLVSRLPGSLADFLPQGAGALIPGTVRKTASVASNVRYEDGVVCAAAGYQKVVLVSSILAGLIASWHLDEPASPFLDATGNGRSLTEQPGNDPIIGGIFHVGSETGKFGNAVLFTALEYAAVAEDDLTLDLRVHGAQNPTVVRVYDRMMLDVSLSAKTFYNPRVQTLEDGIFGDISLGSGAYVQVVFDIEEPEDKLFDDISLISGAYVNTVITEDAPHAADDISMDNTLASGSCILTVIPVDAPHAADDISLDDALASGAKTQTVFNIQMPTDGLLLTVSLGSGSYS